MTKKKSFGMVFGFVLLTAFGSAEAVELPSFVTAKARAACESDVRRYCVKGNVNYNTIKNCIRKNWNKISNDCQYEIVSLLPEIEKYEKLHNK